MVSHKKQWDGLIRTYEAVYENIFKLILDNA